MAEISSYYCFIILLRAEVLPKGNYGNAEETTHNRFQRKFVPLVCQLAQAPFMYCPLCHYLPRPFEPNPIRLFSQFKGNFFLGLTG